jgi:hypothetical protein
MRHPVSFWVLASGSMTDARPIDDALPPRERTSEERERDLRIAKRQELVDHVDHIIRPPAEL